MPDGFCSIREGEGSIAAAAIHDGHSAREEIAPLFALGDSERLREEDPETGKWTEVAPTRIVGLRSRFEVDLNRPREKAIYIRPEDAWGLTVWRENLSDALIEDSRKSYDTFYEEMRQLFSNLKHAHGNFVLYDLHTYNHRREGPDKPPADPRDNPEVNIGTGAMDRNRWGPVVDRFMADLRSFDFLGRHLDVRENVKFQGGHLARWTHENFPDSGCALAIEFKKFFMDEWTGEIDRKQADAILSALRSTVPGVLETLKHLDAESK